MALSTVNNITVFRFIKKLATPFSKWRAYKHGIIDENGNILRHRNELETRNEKDSFTQFDLLVLNIKKAMSHIPGGDSRIASYAAALYLIKEYNSVLNVDCISEEMINEITTNINEDNEYFNFIEYIPTNHTSSSEIAGLGTDSITPKIHKPIARRHKIKARKSKETFKNESK